MWKEDGAGGHGKGKGKWKNVMKNPVTYACSHSSHGGPKRRVKEVRPFVVQINNTFVVQSNNTFAPPLFAQTRHKPA